MRSPTLYSALWRTAISAAISRQAIRNGAARPPGFSSPPQPPKLGLHRDAIRASIAHIVGIPLDRVAIKATTSEGLGFTGREEGIAALAIATIRLPL